MRETIRKESVGVRERETIETVGRDKEQWFKSKRLKSQMMSELRTGLVPRE